MAKAIDLLDIVESRLKLNEERKSTRGELEVLIKEQERDCKEGDFAPLWNSDKRYFLLTGGRGSLKSSSVQRFIIMLCAEEKGHGVLFTRYTMKSAEASIIPEFEIVLKRLGVYNDWKITKTKAIHKNGSFVYFSGIKVNSKDQTGNLKSIAGITTWIVEEGEDFKDEKKFDTIDDSIRTATMKNRIIWIQNPTTKEHFIYKRWIEPKNKKVDFYGYDVTVSDVDEVEHIHTTYHKAAYEHKYLQQSWIDKAEKAQAKAEASDNKQKSYYYHNYIGGWLFALEGVIYENWIEEPFKKTSQLAMGLDYGNSPDPLALIEVSLDRKEKKMYVRELIYKTDLSNDQLKLILDNRVQSKKAMIICDTNEERTRKEIAKWGYNIQKAKKGAGSVAAGIRAIKSWTLVVDPESSNLKKELNNYIWNDKKASVPIDDYNHLLDAMRYAFERLSKGHNNIMNYAG